MSRPPGAAGVNLEARETDPPHSAQSTDLAHRLQGFDNVMQWVIRVTTGRCRTMEDLTSGAFGYWPHTAEPHIVEPCTVSTP
jgi:hypothetical protein